MWSHAHFYHDEHDKKSQPLPVQVQVKVPKEIKSAGKRIATAFSVLDLPSSINRGDPTGRSSSTHQPYSRDVLPASSSSVTLDSEFVEIYIPKTNHPGTSTTSLLDQPGLPATQGTIFSNSHIRGDAITTEAMRQSDSPPQEGPNSRNNLNRQSSISQKEPQLSWPLTLFLMLVVTIVRCPLQITETRYWSVHFKSVAITAESLVESMDGISSTISKDWVGLIVLPCVSAIAGMCDIRKKSYQNSIIPIECITAVNVSFRDELTLSVSVAVGSSIVGVFIFFRNAQD